MTRRPTLSGRLAAFGTRNLVRIAHWRGRRDDAAQARNPQDQTFRGFVQINIIRPH